MSHHKFEVGSREKALELAHKLWEKHKVTGEIDARKDSGGEWVVEVFAEKDLPQNFVDKLQKDAPGEETGA